MITFEKSAGAVVFRKSEGNLKFLLLFYPSGHWDFPKGHMEKGETEEETSLRETAEETGLSNLRIIPEFKTSIWYFYRAKGEERKNREKDGRKINIIKKVVYYLTESVSGDIVLSFEHSDFKWLSYEGALNSIIHKNGKNVLKKAHAFLAKSGLLP